MSVAFQPRSLEEALELRSAHSFASPHRVPVAPDDLVGLRPPATTQGPVPIPDVPGQQAVPDTSASAWASRN